MKILVPLFNQFRNAFDIEVSGEIVDVAPHLPITCIVHRNPWRQEKGFGRWQISVAENGCRIGTMSWATREQAIAYARDRCANKTPQDVERAFRKFPKESKR